MSVFKSAVIVLTAFPAVGFLIAMCARYVSAWFALPLVLWAAFCWLWGDSLKCPRCDEGVAVKRVRVGKIDAPVVPLWVPKNCDACGHELD